MVEEDSLEEDALEEVSVAEAELDATVDESDAPLLVLLGRFGSLGQGPSQGVAPISP